MQSNLSAQIDKQKNPKTISKTKEWQDLILQKNSDIITINNF